MLQISLTARRYLGNVKCFLVIKAKKVGSGCLNLLSLKTDNFNRLQSVIFNSVLCISYGEWKKNGNEDTGRENQNQTKTKHS